ncbi:MULTISPECIES: hypothetical protein [Rhodococcus]|uniref:hypothetical protein n=1 Tax=Rhodococcus TaxID=1827 RepID=UPI0007AE3956|nr:MULTISPECIES: hypothetical protein [Rhodococcus]KZL35247.1 hypothetical protein A3852_05755 [Rhodococcus qingshengii]MBQ9051368.1 hypothetical protein [Rhodococcus sp. (in: high G+C Gram-positive bacteria)]MCE4163057.1 hypothetical protein [Rhodococcus sp. Ni2]
MVNNDNVIPVWTLATKQAEVPAIPDEGTMTPDRLAELRTVLAVLAETPIATLEAHPLPKSIDLDRGISLDSASPLATHLSQLISQTSKASSSSAVASGETLYRMVVPAKVAAQVGSGLVKPMTSKAAAGGVHSALIGSSGIAAQASFVPVAGQAAAVGAAGGSAATAGLAAASAGALTVAAPLVLMAVAVGVSAHADHKRELAIENITKLLEKLHDDALQKERNSLNGCRGAIDTATAILLDQGRIGASVGLDSAVHAISVGMADAEGRLKKWQQGLDALKTGRVELDTLRKAFTGIDEDGGEFRAHLELAALAIALKKRVIVLQAVEHAQMDEANPFESFTRALKSDQQRVAKLESGIASLLMGLSELRLDRSHGVRDFVFKSSEVDKMLRTAYLLRELGDGVAMSDNESDVAIEIARRRDGSVVVFPALAA